jgi:hypothetical protein
MLPNRHDLRLEAHDVPGNVQFAFAFANPGAMALLPQGTVTATHA